MIGHNSRTIDPDRIAAELERLGMEWADKHAAACLLEDTEKAVLAEAAADHRAHCKSQAEAESRARYDRKFTDHVKAMVEARREANRARVRFEAFKAKVELLRTNAATDRAIMSLR